MAFNNQVKPLSPEEDCRQKGGIWDAKTKTCRLGGTAEGPLDPEAVRFQQEQEQIQREKEARAKQKEIDRQIREGKFTQPFDLTEEQKPQPPSDVNFQEEGGRRAPQILFDERGNKTGIITPDGKTLMGLSSSEVEGLAAKYVSDLSVPPGTLSAPQVGGAASRLRSAQLEGQQLGGQVGEFNELGVSPTPLDFEQGVLQGITNAIPRGLQAIAGLSILKGGAKVASGGRGLRALGTNPRALGTNPRALAAGGGSRLAGSLGGLSVVAGAAGLLASSIITEFKGQRRNNIDAQKKVLEEGKQTMKDWINLAKADPANRATYLTQYNIVASQVNQAYRQMKLDTQRDLVKFETAIPDLAEFEAFYAFGGERDALDQEMQTTLLLPQADDYAILEMANRRLG